MKKKKYIFKIYEVNLAYFLTSIRFSILLFCCLQVFTCIPSINSEESIECSINVESVMNDNNIANQIDRLLDLGLKYQEATGKKFDYKSILKKNIHNAR